MVRAARDADHGQEAPGRHAQRLASGLDEECLLSVGQVFRVCARPFSQQLQSPAANRDLDVELPLLPSLPFDIGVQLVQTGLELRHFPLHRRQRIRRTGRVRRVRSHGRLDGRLLGFHDGPSFPGSGHSRLLGFREHLPFPFSHSRVLHAQFGGRLTRFQPSGRDRDHRLAFQLLGDRTVPQLALAGRELVDPRHEQFLAFRIAEHPHGAAGPSAVFEVMVHRGPFLPVRVPPVAFPAPGGNAGALLLEPVRVPRRQHALAGIAELADHVGGAAFVFDVQVHGSVALLPAVLRHEGVLLPVRESKKTSPPRTAEKHCSKCGRQLAETHIKATARTLRPEADGADFGGPIGRGIPGPGTCHGVCGPRATPHSLPVPAPRAAAWFMAPTVGPSARGALPCLAD